MLKVKSGVTFNSFADLAQEIGVKAKKPDEAKLRAQREKFCKCFKCGGQMQWIKDSNVLMCRTQLTDSEGNNIMNKDGSYRLCTNIRYLDDKGANYVSKLFLD